MQKTNEGKALTKALQWLQVWDNTLVGSQATPIEVVKIVAPQLKDLGFNEAKNKPEGYLLLRVQIGLIVSFFDANWDDLMANEAAAIAYDECSWMTVPEMKLFLTRIKSGKYPTEKNFTPMVFMQWMTAFIHEVMMLRRSLGEKKEAKAPEATKPVDEEKIKKVIANLIRRFKEIEIELLEQAKKERRERNVTLQRRRDQLIIDLVERDGSQGIAPDKYLMDVYFKALKKLE